ncbi:MAG: response regulator [Candidatus Omnitrophota bacterium]
MQAKILIIDDEKELSDVLKKYLELKGYSVNATYNGKDGIAQAKKDGFNIIIADIRLPDINGIEVIKTIEKLDAQARFLIITGYSITGEVSDLIESSKRIHGYIFKPFKPEHLAEKIEEILSLEK